jgi:membrane-associated PAP2 superfamily phosphatase
MNINMNNYGLTGVNGIEASGLITIQGNVLSGLTAIEFIPLFTSTSVDWSLANLDYIYWCQNIIGAQTLTLPTLNLRIGQRITIRNDSATVALTVDSGLGGLINRGTSFRTATINSRFAVILLCVDNSVAAPIWIALSAS